MAICASCKEFRGKATAVLSHQRVCVSPGWAKISEANAAFDFDKGRRLFRKLMGLVEPMDEETKEALRQYKEDHREELEEKARLKRLEQQRIKEMMKPTNKRRDDIKKGSHRGRHVWSDGECRKCGKKEDK